MKTRHLIPHTVLLTVLAALLPVQGSETPQEIFRADGACTHAGKCAG